MNTTEGNGEQAQRLIFGPASTVCVASKARDVGFTSTGALHDSPASPPRHRLGFRSPPGFRAQRTKELDKFKIDVQRFIEDAQAELMGVQRDMENAFLAKLRPALAQVAKEKKIQVVFNADEGAIAWVDPSLDITPDIVKQLAAAPAAKNP